jgi:diguanylate cyclase (GGDEF)-like protein
VITHQLTLSAEALSILDLNPATFDGQAQSVLNTRVHPKDLEIVRNAAHAVLEGGQPEPMSFRVISGDGRAGVVWVTADVEHDERQLPVALAGHIVDMGEFHMHRHIAEARLRILEFAPDHTLEELLEKTLDEAELLSGSQIGFYHFVDEDQVNLTLQNWSTRTKAEYCTASAKGEHYPVAVAGVWTDCIVTRAPVVHNDYASLEHRKGLPEGHAQLVRELVVPVMRRDKVQAILGVGNKLVDYDQADVEAVSMLADLAWEIAENKVAQEALENIEDRYRLLYENMNEGVIFQRADGTILSANSAAQRILGLTNDEFTARTSLDPRWESVHEDGSPFPGTEHPTMVALRTGLPVLDVTIGLFNPVEDQRRWMIVSAIPLFKNRDPRPYEAFVTLTDITDLKRSRKDVERTNELLIGLRDATSHLLAHHRIDDTDIAAALHAVAVSSDVDCAYIYENPDASDASSRDREGWLSWCREVGAVSGPPTESEREAAFGRWYDRFAAGDVVTDRVDELTGAEREEFSERGVSSVLAVPVFSEGRLWGCVVLESGGDPRKWKSDEVETLRKAASTLGATIEMSNRALHDSLTGLYNRRYLEEVLIQSHARAVRESSPLSVVVFDVDDFKAINDSRGHAAGDEALREMSRHLLRYSRAEDTTARLGGDEFAVVMPSATAENAVKSIERWRRVVEMKSTAWGTLGGTRFTISAGVSSTATAHTPEDLLEQADRAMFAAKRAGRNRTLAFEIMAPEPVEPTAPAS